MSAPACTCPDVKAALHYALTETTPPPCGQHGTTDPGAPADAIALNNNQALAAIVGATLTGSEN